MGNIPFDRGLFWKVLPAVYALVIVAWTLVVKLTDYEVTSADYGGSFISSTIFGYLIHLWLLPGEYEEYDDEEFDDEHGDDREEDEIAVDASEESGRAG